MSLLKACTAAVVLLCASVPVHGQNQRARFEDLYLFLEAGDQVYVTARGGEDVRGVVVRMSATALVIAVDGREREFPESMIVAVARRGDPSYDGAIKAGAGTVWGAYLMTHLNCEEYGGCDTAALRTVGFTAAAAGVGWFWDRLVQRRTAVYPIPSARRVRVVPVLGSGRTFGTSILVNWK